MRHNREMTDEKRLALLDEFLSSGKSKHGFEKENGLGGGCILKWLRTFAVETKVENKPVVSLPQAAVTDMKKDPDKEELLQVILCRIIGIIFVGFFRQVGIMLQHELICFEFA